MLGLTPKWAIWCNGNTPKIRVELGWGQEHKKSAISPKRCKIGPRLLWRTNRKSHTRFRLAPKSMTLDDLGWPWTAETSFTEINKNYGAHQKNLNKVRSMLLAAKCRPMILISRNIKYIADIRGSSIGEGRTEPMSTELLATFKINIRSMRRIRAS